MPPNETETADGKDVSDWNPEPAKLREGETRDYGSHASRNIANIRAGRRRDLRENGEPELLECIKCGAEATHTVGEVFEKCHQCGDSRTIA